MKTVKRILTTLILMALLLPAAAMAAEVAQGVCKEFDTAKHLITIEEYDTNFSAENKYGAPTGIVSQFDVSTAKVGIEPKPGDILRLSYKVEGNVKTAYKVMNVSKQDLMKK
ncbi:MAG: hypothetical protein AB7E47_01340 [Desulfovibrionaceae bacterium]